MSNCPVSEHEQMIAIKLKAEILTIADKLYINSTAAPILVFPNFQRGLSFALDAKR